jgi:phosphoglycolate phosphatase-like HAD superfamily hydrolase
MENTEETVRAFLEEHGLEGYIRAVYGVDMPGSKVDKILMAKSQFAAKGETVFMVGDSLSDVRAAREAGVTGTLTKGVGLLSSFFISMIKLRNSSNAYTWHPF